MSSCSGFALWCSLPSCLYSQCAPALVPHVMRVLQIFGNSCSGFAIGYSLLPCPYSQCAPALVPGANNVPLICVSSLLLVCSQVFTATVSSCFGSSWYECAPNLSNPLLGFALGCSPWFIHLYSQCAPAMVPCAMSVLLICLSSCSGFAFGCSLPPCLYS